MISNVRAPGHGLPPLRTRSSKPRRNQNETPCVNALAAICTAGTVAGQTRFSTIYNISVRRPNGLALLHGAIYGVVWDTGCGYVFQLQPPSVPGEVWNEDLLHTFAQTDDGCGPTGPLVPGAGGSLYGLTEAGGQNDYGTVYQLQPPASPGGPWTETVAYSFNAINDEGGGNPESWLTAGPAGSFYVVDQYNSGSLLQLIPPADPIFPWTGALLYELGEGGNWVVAGPHGALYAMEATGGIYGEGSIVQIAPPQAPGGEWTQNLLYSFGCCNESAPGNPDNLTAGPDGTFYGTTWGENPGIGYYFGAGAAFSLTPPSSPGGDWTYATLHYFGGNHPDSALVLYNGNLYGTVQTFDGGTVFELQPPTASGGPWSITYLHNFNNYQIPLGLVIDKNGTIYGMTDSYPTDPPSGTIFKIETQ